MKNEILHNIPDYEGIGIYSIVSDNSEKTYIGSSINVRKRLLQHKTSFKALKCPVAFKEELLQSLEYFKNNPEMTRYIQNIIAKRETPIFKNTSLKGNRVEQYQLFKLYLLEHVFSKLTNQIDSKKESDINNFIIRAINETMERNS